MLRWGRARPPSTPLTAAAPHRAAAAAERAACKKILCFVRAPWPRPGCRRFARASPQPGPEQAGWGDRQERERSPPPPAGRGASAPRGAWGEQPLHSPGEHPGGRIISNAQHHLGRARPARRSEESRRVEGRGRVLACPRAVGQEQGEGRAAPGRGAVGGWAQLGAASVGCWGRRDGPSDGESSTGLCKGLAAATAALCRLQPPQHMDIPVFSFSPLTWSSPHSLGQWWESSWVPQPARSGSSHHAKSPAASSSRGYNML